MKAPRRCAGGARAKDQDEVASGSERSAVLGDSDGLLLRLPDLAPQPRRRDPVARLAAHRSRRQACGGGQAEPRQPELALLAAPHESGQQRAPDSEARPAFEGRHLQQQQQLVRQRLPARDVDEVVALAAEERVLRLADDADDISRRCLAAAACVAEPFKHELCPGGSACGQLQQQGQLDAPARRVSPHVADCRLGAAVQLREAEEDLDVDGRRAAARRLRGAVSRLEIVERHVPPREELLGGEHLVVLAPRRLVRQALVRLAQLTEEDRCRRHLLVALSELLVRVEKQREAPECAPHLCRRAVAREAEPVVVILLSRERLHLLSPLPPPLLLALAHHELKAADSLGALGWSIRVRLGERHRAVTASRPHHRRRLRGGERLPLRRECSIVHYQVWHRSRHGLADVS
mmetsp:Transcript_19717/g.63529  ORF Transcript_19717/g.63529 Transcript_19717/m.63529 type:complete len:406 (-) Transcript_19717:48-1265(-)